MATQKGSDTIGAILLELGVIHVIDESEIAWLEEHVNLAGAFGVEKLESSLL